MVLRRWFGERVRNAIERMGLTPSDLAARCSLSVTRTERILSGQPTRISLEDMAIIASVVGVPLDSLLDLDAMTVPGRGASDN
jgi:transcriptional regulator with XRE-family HTH domain